MGGGFVVTVGSRGGDVWFPDISAWPSPDSDNAAKLATSIEAADLTILTFRVHTPPTAPIGTVHRRPMAAAPASGAVTTLTPPEPAVPEPIRPVTPEPRRRRPMLVALVAAVAVAGVIAIVATAMVVSTGEENETATGPASTPPSTAAASEQSAETCAASTVGTRTTGNGPGDQSSGPGVILAFNHAYYVQRNATAVRAFTRGNVTQEVPELQRFIDAVAPGTTYCLTVDDRGGGLYALKIEVASPNLPPEVIPQLVETTKAEGKTWITAIRKDESTPA